jgi:deoxyribodipyrimidine photolyase-related protein
MAGVTAWVLGDQLSHANPALEGADRVLLVESEAKLRAGRWHRQKLHLVLSAMRHFAAELEERGVEVDHRRSESLAAGLREHVAAHGPDRVLLLRPTSRAGLAALGGLDGVEIVDRSLFLTHPDEFTNWVGDRRRLRMEDFYRWQRRRLGVLMDGEEPVGGRWNFDSENRERPPRDTRPPRPYLPREDAIDERVRADLDAMGLDTFGEDGPRMWPATHDQALRSLHRFVEQRLPDFGRWQDAMLQGEQLMWHGHMSAAMNLGLLDPMACVEAAVGALEEGHAPLNAVEGFVRQVIGWREYVWGTYWHFGDRWPTDNELEAGAALPPAYWGERTDMACISDAVDGLQRTAYAHHIQRLMLFGNLAMLLGVEPRQVFDWFHESFVDGYEWVMAPNVLAMALWADGGRMFTKPYAAGGRYVDRMSDLCGDCRYDPTQRTGEEACPFSTLYWDFMDRHRDRFAGIRRLRNPLRTLESFDPDELAELRRRGRALRDRFDA